MMYGGAVFTVFKGATPTAGIFVGSLESQSSGRRFLAAFFRARVLV
jgi:hypothetical protein